MINSHIHTFLEEDIPRGFLPFGLVRVLNTKVGYFLLSQILTNLNPFSSKDSFDRYVQFIKIGKSKKQEDVLRLCSENYPTGTKFVVLPMDMAFMGAGTVPRNYVAQLAELSELRKKDKSVIPFIHIDPRREDYKFLFDVAIKEWGFRGVKLYPPLGVFPYDERFDSIYSYCQNHRLPVMAHCTSGNPVYYKGSFKKLKELLKDYDGDIDWSLSNKELCSYFTHPLNYKKVFNKFPDLKLCLAHWGRENDWDKIIREMLPKYDGLFVDISYSLYNEEHWGCLKVNLLTDNVFRTRVLFGSDWYMNSIEGKEKQFSINLRAYLGEELWTQITTSNTERYLYG